jgi:hypothetical protein
MRLAVGDDEFGCRAHLPGEPVKGRQQAPDPVGHTGQHGPRWFRERPAVPGLAELTEGGLQGGAVRNPAACPGCRGHGRCGPVQLCQHVDDPAALVGGKVFTEAAVAADDEREKGSRVLRVDGKHRLSADRRDRRQHEPQVTPVPQRVGGVHRGPQAAGHHRPGLAEPDLVIQIIDGDEPPATVPIVHHPVVTPATHGRVFHGDGIQAPAPPQRRHQVGLPQSRWPVPHEGSR